MLAPPQYHVWSTYPPALAPVGYNGVRIIAGTINKLERDGTPIDYYAILPWGTRRSQITWHKTLIVPTSTGEPTTRIVKGSKGDEYTVRTYPGGRVTCTCYGYMYRKTCKHVK